MFGCGPALLVPASGVISTWNPSDKDALITLTNMNLTAGFSSGSDVGRHPSVRGTLAAPSGKRQFEIEVTGDAIQLVGVGLSSASLSAYPGGDSDGWSYYGGSGNKFNSGSSAAFGASYAVNDVIGVVIDGDNLTFYKNGALQGTAFTGMAGRVLYPMWGTGSAIGARGAIYNGGGKSALAYPVSGVLAWDA